MKTSGYNLLEVMVATSVLTVVSLLGFVVLKSSNDAAQLTTAKADVQNHLRDTMGAVTAELREGVTQATTELTGAPDDLFPVRVDDAGKQITFQVPDPQPGDTETTYTAPITFMLENEDGNGNGRLDAGEDENNDGVLTRRLIRVQDGLEAPVASANSIDTVEFQLVQNLAADNDNPTTVTITLTGSRRYGHGDGKRVVSQTTASIRLVN